MREVGRAREGRRHAGVPTLERISYGMPLNWRSGVCEPHMRRMTHLDSMRALSVRPAHPRRMHTSNRQRISRPAAAHGGEPGAEVHH